MANGEGVKTVQELLRHADFKVTKHHANKKGRGILLKTPL
jgi:hypothetical protein